MSSIKRRKALLFSFPSLCKTAESEIVSERNVEGDGNCFYRCLSVAMYGTEDLHGEIRQEICDFISHHKENFECFLDEQIDQHIQKQRKMDGSLSSWATEAEFHAASARYETNIKVTMSKENLRWHNHTLRISENGAAKTSLPFRNSIHLLLTNHHFSVLHVRQVGAFSDTEKSYAITRNFDWFEMRNGAEENSESARPETEVEPEIGNLRNSRKDSRNVGANKINKVPSKPHNPSLNRKSNKNGIAKRGKSEESTAHTKSNKAGCSSEMDTVTNLSTYSLTAGEISLLSKGVKFIPDKHKVNMVKLLADLNEWERQMRLREYFYKEKEEEDEDRDEQFEEQKFRVKRKSFFTPAKGRDMWLDLYIESVKRDIIGNLKRSGKLNLTKQEQAAFHSLLDNDNIVIRPADKGSGVVVMNRSEYILKLEHEMDNSASYETTESDLTQDSLKSV